MTAHSLFHRLSFETYTEVRGYSFRPKMDLGEPHPDGSRPILKKYPGVYLFDITGYDGQHFKGECTEDEKTDFVESYRSVQAFLSGAMDDQL